MNDHLGLLPIPDTGSVGNAALQGMQAVPALPALTPPHPIVITEEVAFYSQYPSLSMHRKDGKRITFKEHLFISTQLHDTQYLDEEIAAGLPGIRRATEAEVAQYRFLLNPLKATEEATEKRVAAQLTQAFSAQLEQARAQMEAQLRAEFEERIRVAEETAGLRNVKNPSGKDVNPDNPAQSGSAGEVAKNVTAQLKPSVVESPVPVLTGLNRAASRLGAAGTSSMPNAAASNSK